MSTVDECSLCSRLKTQVSLFETPLISVFEGPFWARWPGHLMCVYKNHLLEQSDIPEDCRHDVFDDIIDSELAIRATVNPSKLNVAKFGNVVSHLHWHIIPRFESENFPEKTVWELLNLPVEQLHKCLDQKFFDKDSLKTQLIRQFINRQIT